MEGLKLIAFPDPPARSTIVALAREADDALKLSGRSGGQVANGGADSGDDLELHSNPSKDGLIKLGDDSAYDEANDRLGIGTTNPGTAFHSRESSASEVVSGQFENAGGGNVQFRVLTSTRSWALRVASDHFRIRDVTGATEPVILRSGAPSSSLEIDGAGRLSLGPGSPRFVGRTATAADPTTTELPADKDFGLHKNTSSGAVFLAYNDGGTTIKKVALT